jgi:hypothetical protein
VGEDRGPGRPSTEQFVLALHDGTGVESIGLPHG